MNKRLWIAAAASCALVAFSLYAPDALAQAAADQTQQRFDGIIDQFRAQSQMWQAALIRSARYLFFGLALIQFAWTNMQLALKGGDVSEWISTNTKQVLAIGIFWVFLERGASWSRAFIQGFLHAGDMAITASAPGNAGALDPAGVFQNGLVVAGSLFSQMSVWSGADNVALVICALVMLICFAFLAAFMAVVLVESYIIIGGSTLFLAFGGSSWTSDIAKRVLFYVVAVGAKLFVLQLIVGVAMGSVITWAQTYESDSSTDTLSLVGLILLITVCAKMIPELVQSILTGSSVGGTGAMMGTIAAAAGAAIAGGAVVGGAIGGGGAAGAAGTGAGTGTATSATGATSGATGAAQFGAPPSSLAGPSMPGRGGGDQPPAPMGPISSASIGTSPSDPGGVIRGAGPASAGDTASGFNPMSAVGAKSESASSVAAAVQGLGQAFANGAGAAPNASAVDAGSSATATASPSSSAPSSSSPASGQSSSATPTVAAKSATSSAAPSTSSTGTSAAASVGGNAAPSANGIQGASKFGGEPTGITAHASEPAAGAAEASGSAADSLNDSAASSPSSGAGPDSPAGLPGSVEAGGNPSNEEPSMSAADAGQASESPLGANAQGGQQDDANGNAQQRQRGELPGPNHAAQMLGHLVDLGAGVNPIAGSAMAFRSGDRGEPSEEGEDGKPPMPGGATAQLADSQGSNKTGDEANRLQRAKQGAVAGFLAGGPAGAAIGAATGAALAPKIDEVASKAKAAFDAARERLGVNQGEDAKPPVPPTTD